MKIRPTQAGDIAALQAVLDATELFPSELLPDMIAPFFGADTPGNLWLSCEMEGSVIGLCYAQPEELTDGTWNMRAIAVAPAHQGQGAGAAITADLEQRLKTIGARVLIVDTSGTDDFAQTRAFYSKNGYETEARIRDFWAAGDDKVIFRKAL